MDQVQIKLQDIAFDELFDKVEALFPDYTYDFKKHGISLPNEEHDIVGFVRLPLHIAISEELEVLDENVNTLYLSLESGYASICVMEGEENVYHTTFSAYMTRKKQGFSQIKYLNKKGKSRAGSRMRLTATTEFFERINKTLIELFDSYGIDRIALNCTKTLIPYLFQSKVECPFEKSDERLYKIPLHIPQSNFTNLDAAIKKLAYPVLFYNSEHENLMTDLIDSKDEFDD